MEKKNLSRRHFLAIAASVTAGSVLAACAPKEIIKTVEVEKTVQVVQTVEVEKQVTQQVEKIVEVTSTPKAVNANLVPAPAYKYDGGPVWQAPDLTGKTMILWGLQYDPHIDRYKELIKLFTAHTGANVDLQPQPWPLDQPVMAALAAGTPPDVICWMGKMLPPLIRQKAVVAIDDLFSTIGLNVDKWFRPGASGAYLTDGKYWGVPVEDNGDGFSVSARIDLIRDADKDSQAIWADAQKNNWFNSYDEMWKLAAALKKVSKTPIMGLTSQGWNTHSLLGIMRSLGTTWWDESNQRFNMDNDACVQALDMLITKPFALGIEAITGNNLVDTFVAGKAGLARGNFSAAGEAQKVGFATENVAAPCVVPGQAPLFYGEGGWGFEMPIKIKNQDVAIEFMKFMCTYEAQHCFSQIYGGGMPSCNPVATSDIYQGDDPFRTGLRRCVAALGNCIYFGHNYGNQDDVETAIDGAFSAMYEGKLKSKVAAKQIQDQLTAQLVKWNSEA
jgi:ABC-type glycerol-3-phosphate transport system substrate-binding protein